MVSFNVLDLYSADETRSPSFWNRMLSTEISCLALFIHGDMLAYVPAHSHSYYELTLFQDCRLSYEVEGELFDLAPGNILLVPPTLQHRPVAEKDVSIHRVTVCFSPRALDAADPDGVLSWSRERRTGTLRPHLLRPAQDDRDRLFNLAHTLAAETLNRLHIQNSRTYCPADKEEDSPNRSSLRNLLVDSLLTQLLVEMDRVHLNEMDPLADPSAEQLVRRVATYVDEHLPDDLSLDYLADTFYVSKYTLCRKFRQYTGESLHGYISRRRLASAVFFIQCRMPLHSIYRKCGYADYSSFYRAFKRLYGVSPQSFCLTDAQIPAIM